MLIFGDHNILGKLEIKNLRVYNMGSIHQTGMNISNLIPAYNTIDNKEFDLYYANSLLHDKTLFITYMQIIYDLYMGFNVFVLVNGTKGDYSEYAVESLIKFIQQRYGIISNVLESEEDFDTLVEHDFSLTGLYNLDIDKEKFNILTSDPVKLMKLISEIEAGDINGDIEIV